MALGPEYFEVIKGYTQPKGTPPFRPGVTPSYQAQPTPEYNAQQYITGLMSKYAAQMEAALAKVKQRPWIPSLDTAAVTAQAKQAAASVVNPLFQRQLNDFLAQQAARKKWAQEDYQTQIKQAEKTLADYFGEAGLTRGRTTEDVGYNLARLAEEERARQQTEARQFDIGKRGLQEQLGQTGLTFSGLGRQQLQEVGVTRKETEQAQTRQLAEQQRTQELMKTRTFEDLARGEKLAGETEVETKRISQQGLERSFQELIFQEQEKRFKLRQEEEVEMSRVTKEKEQEQWRDYLARLRTPEQKEEAGYMYGGYF